MLLSKNVEVRMTGMLSKVTKPDLSCRGNILNLVDSFIHLRYDVRSEQACFGVTNDFQSFSGDTELGICGYS